MSFNHLHLHSIFSTLDGCASPEQYVERAAKYGHTSLALTDHGKAGGWFRLQQSCLKKDIKPIFGIEMYVNDELVTIGEKDKRIRKKDNHLILLAKNKEGYENLLHLNYLSMKDEEHFYYSPRVTFEELFKCKEGIVVGSACIGSPFGNLCRKGEYKEAILLLTKFQEEFKDDFYIEIQLNELTNKMDNLEEGQKTYNQIMISVASKIGVPVVMTGDVHYLEKGQDKIQTYSIMIRNKDTIGNTTFELESKHLYYHNIEDYLEFNDKFGYNYKKETIEEYCNNTQYIADKVNVLIPKRKKMHLPKITENDDKALVEKVKKGIVSKLNVASYNDVPEEYRKRISYELEIIMRKGFSSYYLIFEDMYRFMRENKIPFGSSRGSGGGSLLFYALGVITIDPIKYNLLFERFISEQRASDMVLNYFRE